MARNLRFLLLCALCFLAQESFGANPPTMAEVLAAAKSSDWRPLDPNNTLYVELPAGRVIIELSPRFAPRHVHNIETLARAHYFDGLSVLRVQDDYVAQWGDPDDSRSVPPGIDRVAPEFEAALAPQAPFTRLPDGDVYAPEVGFSDGFPAARSPRQHATWLIHCYGMVGVARDLDVQSGNGTQLYVVIGHAPRQLDRNVALVGRVVAGMPLLASLPRGSGELGFYAQNETRMPITAVRIAADVAPAERTPLEILRTDTATFAALIESRRNRPEEFFKTKAGRIEVCNVPLAVRAAPPAAHSP
jgi:peptidylprolyl isomerase